MQKFFKKISAGGGPAYGGKKYKIFQRKLPLVLAVLGLIIAGAVFLILRQDTETVKAGWYSSGGSWGYRKAIVVDNTKVSGSTNLTDFTMLFSVTDADLKDTVNGGKVGKSDGSDILFTSSDGTTKLSHEIEKYSSSTGETIAWVKIPSLSATSDTTIYIYYGNASASDQQDITGTWDTNYKYVYHMPEDPSGTAPQILDSTSNNNDAASLGTMLTEDQVAGKIDGSLDFDGSNDYIKITAGNYTTIGDDITFSTWLKSGNTSIRRPLVHFGQTSSVAGSWALRIDDSVLEFLTWPDGGVLESSYATSTSGDITNQTWKFFTATRSSSTGQIKLYINGVNEDTVTGQTGQMDDAQATKDFYVARAYSNWWNGILDEVKISNVIRSADWITTEYNNQSSPSTFYSYTTGDASEGAPGGLVKVVSVDTWYNTSWTYRKKISINKDKVASSTDMTLTNFPVLFSVTDTDLAFTGSSGHVASSTGADILFTSSDGTTKLSHEIESYASTTGELVAWVKIPKLPTTSDSYFYIYYGNASAADQQDAVNVWNEFQGVWHLGETSGTTISDSTSNGADGTKDLATAPDPYSSGKIGGAQDFDKSVGTDSITIDTAIRTDTTHTVSGWVHPDQADGSQQWIWEGEGTSLYDNGLAFNGYSNNWYYRITKTSGTTEGTVQYPSGSWRYVVLVHDGSNIILYVDGAAEGLTVATPVAYDFQFFGNSAADNSGIDGQIDEMRLADAVRSADWIATEYNNQNSPSTFYTIGSEERKDNGESSFSNWYDTNWSYRKQIVIDANKVSGSTDLTDFPILFSVTDADLKFTGSGGKVASSTGGDILFTQGDGKNKLSHEIESYASTTGELVAWVKIPTLSATTDTTIYVYYGNASATDQQDATNVWDSNYVLTMHLGEGDSTDANFYQDSTSNNNDGQLTDTDGDTVQDDCIIGKCVDFNGDADLITHGNTNFPPPSSETHTYSVWFREDTPGSDANAVVGGIGDSYSSSNRNSGLVVSTAGDIGVLNRITNSYYDTGINRALDNWHYFTVTNDDATIRPYVDGVPGTTVTTGSFFNTENLRSIGGNNVSSNGYFRGAIDEVRLSTSIRSADWIKTEYNNQNSPSTFYAYGASQTENRQDSSGNLAPAIKSRGGVKFR